MNNNEVRKQFEQWHTANLKPHFKLVAEKLGITESYFVNWKNGKRDVSDELLKRINRFIENN